MKMKKCVIVGVGLIGGSIGKALVERALSEQVVGICRRESSLKRALDERSVTAGFVNDYEKALEGADLVIVATPVGTVKKVLGDIAKAMPVTSRPVVTDAGSTKEDIMRWASEYENIPFVGGHPIAGSEKKGVENASADLFESAMTVLCPGSNASEEDVQKVSALWRSLGSEVVHLSPKEHDEALAFTSHLPHAVSFALALCQRREALKFASTGFADTTRLAGSDPALWKDIFLSNSESALSAIGEFKRALTEIEQAIGDRDEDSLLRLLARSKKVRDEFAGQD